MVFHQVLVPTDGSENSVQAALLAYRIVRLCGAALTLVYVVDTAVLGEIARFSAHQQAEVRQELYENGRQYLDYLESLAAAEHLAVQSELREGIPFEEIVDAAGRLAADLIVMGHVGRRGPRRILIGSVTERVIEFAHCPVLVVKG
jgi:nucleotide-binding universal stress UspA family protein